MARIRYLSFTTICVCLISMAATTVATAQDFGITAGWNRSTIEWDETFVDWKSKNGFSVGGYAAWGLARNLGLRTELVYTRKGTMDTGTAVNDQGEVTGEFDYFYNFDYIEVPVLAKITIPTSGKVAPYILAGAAVAFEVSAKGKIEGLDDFEGDSWDIEGTESIDLGVIIGGGVEFEMGSRTLTVDIRYNLGLTEVFYDGKNRCLSAMVGVGF